ncbi:uncharacterized protein [Dysidea avara]|uniref:uncharacterized protein n=1 Tax=Dysidea avara TaxID=196820 RepID=UPI00332D42CE
MFGLLGGESDFSDTSDSDEPDQDVDEATSTTDKSHTSDTTSTSREKLPLPDLEVPLSQQGKISVFSSQYKEEEKAKEAVLERHVELSSAAPIVSKTQAKKEARKGHRSSFQRSRQIECTSEDQPKVKRKRHAGLSGTLQPPKKFMQSYHKQQTEEKPWLNKK